MAEQYIRPFIGADEFLNGKTRWCLWFQGISDVKRNHDLKQMPKVQARIQAVKTMREASSDKQTQKDAATPWLFQKIRQPSDGNFLIIPRVSSESRRFIPIGYLSFETVVSDLVFTLPNATLYHFGILCSTMHNAFMRTVAGRLESRYRYSNTVVYNNFPFPESCRKPNDDETACQEASGKKAKRQGRLKTIPSVPPSKLPPKPSLTFARNTEPMHLPTICLLLRSPNSMRPTQAIPTSSKHTPPSTKQ